MCDCILKLRREKTTFHVLGKLFKASVYLQIVISKDEEKVIKFDMYNHNPKLRIWSTTYHLHCRKMLHKNSKTTLTRGQLVVYCRNWECIDEKYYAAASTLIYMCCTNSNAYEIMQRIGVNYEIFVSYKNICDFMLFTQKNNVSID